MNTRIYNVKVLTMADGFGALGGEVWIEGSQITFAGDPGERTRDKKEQSDHIKWDREIDGGGNLVMPGFKNAHTHSGMTFLRSHADDYPLLAWLNEQVFPFEAKLTPDDIYHLSKLAILEYLTSGMTANFDMYLTPDTIAQASKDCGFRTVMTGAVNDFSQSVPLLEQWYKDYNKPDSLISFELGFHAQYTTSESILRDIASLAKQYKAPVYTHNSEGIPEVEQCLKNTGATPTAYLNQLGIFDYGGGCYHCVHMTEEDLHIIKEKNLSVILNPSSNLKLASGIAPANAMLQMGINLAIGTDGPASNNCLDMFREMFLVTGLSKYLEQNAAVMDANKVLFMATVGGARAMGLSGCDTLQKGKLADLIMIDLNQPNMQPVHNLTKNLVYSGSKQNVKLVMVNGKILYEDGEFYVGEPAGRIYEKAEEISRRILGEQK